MDSSQLRSIANFLDLFNKFTASVTGFASDHPGCFARDLWDSESKKIILDNIKHQLEMEKLNNHLEMQEHPEDAQAMISLFQLVINQLER